MRKNLFILGGLALLLVSGYAAEIPIKSDGMAEKEPMIMEETKIKTPMMVEEPTIIEETRKDIPMMVEEPIFVEEIKKEPTLMEEAVIEDQPMMADKSLTEQPMPQEAVMAEPIVELVMDEPLPAGEEDQVANARGFGDATAADVLKRIYAECVQVGSFACVKPKVLAFLSSASKKDKIMVTRDLSIEKTGKYYPVGSGYQQWNAVSPNDAATMLERIDDFLSSHELKLRVPKEIVSGELLPFVPKFLLQNVPSELQVPLADTKSVGQERGFLKKIVMPFLLGLKFKATALVPLALTLIALKTWKALTLGLLSLVLSGALLIFKFSKPKVATYEVVHVPHHSSSSIVEHPAPANYDHHGYGRGFDAQPLAYRAYRPL